MKRKKLLFPILSAIFILQYYSSSAQTYCMPTSGTQTVTALSGNFYDSGCAILNYSNNENGEIIFCSPSLSCSMTTLTFNSIGLSDLGDVLRIWNGIGTGGTLLQTFQGPLNITSANTVYSVDPSGCLTVTFISNATAVASGWAATLGCSLVAGTNQIIAGNLPFSYISPDQTGNNFLNINLSAPSSFTTTIFSADGKKVFSQNYSLAGGANKIFLPTENLPQGIYFCQLTGENVSRAFKFVR